LQEFLHDGIDESVWERFQQTSYLKIDLTQPDQYQQLNAVIDQKSELWLIILLYRRFYLKTSATDSPNQGFD